MPFTRLNEDPEYDDDLTAQELEDMDEDEFMERVQVPIDLKDIPML